MGVNPRHVAEGAETRMRQLHRALEGSRPLPSAKQVAWDVTKPLRGRFPALQEALARPAQFALVAVDREVIAEAVEKEGVRLPSAPRRAETDVLPREGARLVGHVEEAAKGAGGLDGSFGRWVEARQRLAGNRGPGAAQALAAATGSADEARRYGMALADAALGVPGASLPGLPEGFAFAHHPATIYMDEFEDGFANEVASMLSRVAEDDEARFEGYRLLGRFERLNGMDVNALYDREECAYWYDIEALARDCALAAMGEDHQLKFTLVPEGFPAVFEAARAPEPAPGM